MNLESNLSAALAHSVLFFAREAWASDFQPIPWGQLQLCGSLGGSLFDDILNPDPPAPVTRDPNAEASAALLSQMKAERGIDEFSKVGKRSDLEREFQGIYTQLAIDQANLATFGNKGNNGYLDLLRRAAPEAAAIEADARDAQQNREIALIEQYGPRARQAIENYDPRTTALMNAQADRAQEKFAAGRSGTPSEIANDLRSIRAAQSYRGLGFGPTDAYQEALYLGDRGRRREQENERYASAVADQRTTWLGGPYEAILNRQLKTSPQLTVAGANAYNQGNVFNTHAYDNLYDFNANSVAAANIAGANNKAAITGALIGLGGRAAGAAMGGGAG